MSISSVQPVEGRMEAMKRAATRLLSGPVSSIEPIGGGRNSQVYRLTDSNSQTYALKAYFRHASDKRDRLRTEFSSLQFLWESGVRDVPQPLVADWGAGCALYEYIDGQKIIPDTITNSEIDTAVGFLTSLKDLRDRDGASHLSPASEACFSVQAIVESIRRRLKALNDQRRDEEPYIHLYEFLDSHFAPKLEEVVRWVRASLGRARMSFERDIDPAERTLSPSDFGLHNALKCNDGRIVFLDFEYFGWDDPAKMTADVLLHPAMNLVDSLKRRFARGIRHSFADYPHLARRVEIVYPLFGLKWCTILLNEFLPEHLIRRQFAGLGDRDQVALQMEQLTKAKRMLQTISDDYEHFPYFD